VGTSTATAAIDTLGCRVARRRFRTVEEKIQIIAESRVPGVSVSEVARRHVVNANQIFAWRRQQDQGVLNQRMPQSGVKLLPVHVRGESEEPETQASSVRLAVSASEDRIEITLVDGVRIVVSGAVSADQLHRVLSVLRR
jgi:transposase